MADIQITGLPFKSTISNTDFLHVRGNDEIDYKVPVTVFREALRVGFTPGGVISARNLQDAIDQAATIDTGIGGGYFTRTNAQKVWVGDGPNANFSSLSDAISYAANFVSSDGEVQRPRQGSESVGLVDIILDPDYVWTENITLNGGANLSHIYITNAKGSTAQIDANLRGFLLEVSNRTISPVMALNIDAINTTGSVSCFKVSGKGSQLLVGEAAPRQSSQDATDGVPATGANEGGLNLENFTDTAILCENGASVYTTDKVNYSGRNLPAIKTNKCARGLVLRDGAMVNMGVYNSIVCNFALRGIQLSKGSRLMCGDLVVTPDGSTGDGLLVDGKSIAICVNHFAATYFSNGKGLSASDSSTVFIGGGFSEYNNVNIEAKGGSVVTGSLSSAIQGSYANILADDASRINLTSSNLDLTADLSVYSILSRNSSSILLENSFSSGSNEAEYTVEGFSSITKKGTYTGDNSKVAGQVTVEGIIIEV